MIRVVYPVTVMLAFCSCNSNHDQPLVRNGLQMDRQNGTTPDEIKHKWKRFAINDWYELSELRVNDKQSIIHWRIAKGDPQLGIGVASDIGVLAKRRGFTYFRLSQTDPTETHADYLTDIKFKENIINDLFVVDFFIAKPEKMDRVFDVAMMVMISEQGGHEDTD